MPLDAWLAAVGAASCLGLIVALLIGIRAGTAESRWRIWPAPPAGSAKSFAFWTLFRTLNATVLALGIEQVLLAARDGTLTPVQGIMAACSLAAGVTYVASLWTLGRTATYCRASGLATNGVYRWSRNPQYAAAIVAFATLGLASGDWKAALLAASLALVYALMAIAEEPWLSARYGQAYAEYCFVVPRFFNWRLMLARPKPFAQKGAHATANRGR